MTNKNSILVCGLLMFTVLGLYGQSTFPTVDLLENEEAWEFLTGPIETDTSESERDATRGEKWRMKFFLNSITASKKDPWGIYDNTHFAFSRNEEGRYLRIGNYHVGSETDVAIGTFTVPQEGHYLVLVETQIFVEDPGHSRKEQPSFYVGVERNDQSDPCSEFSDFASRPVFNRFGGCDEFASHSGVPLYRSKWIPIVLDLNGFSGQKLSIRLRVNDCRQGAHFAAMFARVKLMSATLNVNWCNGGEAKVTAPPGFLFYKWSTGQRGQTIVVKNPKAGQQITCNSISVSKCPVSFQTQLREKRALPFSVGTLSPNCHGATGTLLIHADVAAQVFVNDDFIRSTNISSQVDYRALAGIYTIKLQNDSSCSIKQVSLPEPQALVSMLTISDYNGVAVSCKGLKNGHIQLKNMGGVGGYTSMLLHSEGDTLREFHGQEVTFDNLPSGAYKMIISDSNRCQIHLSAFLAEPDSFIVDALSTDAPCHRMAGSVEFSSSGGTGGIKSYEVWRWRDQVQVGRDSLYAGKYEALVWDKNGCHAIDAFRIRQPKPLTTTSKAYQLFGIHFFFIKPTGGSGKYQYSVEKYKKQRPYLINRLAIATKPGMSAMIEIKDKNDCPCTENLEVKGFRLIRLKWDNTPKVKNKRKIICPKLVSQ